MRWSLITLLTLAAVLNEALALPVPESISADFVDLQTRGVVKNQPKKPKSLSAKTSNYRQNARKHAYVYQPTPKGVNIRRIPSKGDQTPGHKRDADHLLEVQTLKHALKKQGTSWEQLHPTHQKAIQRIVNHQRNMAFIRHDLNRGKGQIVKHGGRGFAIKRAPGRDNYFKMTIPTAKKTARHIDMYLSKNTKLQGNVHSTLVDTIHQSGIVRHGSTPSTSPNSSQRALSSHHSDASPHHSPGHPGSGTHSPSGSVDALADALGGTHISDHHSSSSESRPDSPTPGARRNQQQSNPPSSNNPPSQGSTSTSTVPQSPDVPFKNTRSRRGRGRGGA